MLVLGTVYALPTVWATFVVDTIASKLVVRMLAVYLVLLHASAGHVGQPIICEVLQKGAASQLP